MLCIVVHVIGCNSLGYGRENGISKGVFHPILNFFVMNSFNRIKSDQNQDKSLEIMTKWISTVENSYHHIYHELADPPATSIDDKIPTNWTQERFKHIINLREEALNKGRELWADFVWVYSLFYLKNCNLNKSILYWF